MAANRQYEAVVWVRHKNPTLGRESETCILLQSSLYDELIRQTI